MRAFDNVVVFARNDRNRRLAYAVLAVVLAILIVFPQPYVARAKVLPQDSSSAGLGQVVSALGGQLQGFASLLTGGRNPNDLYLIIGRSDVVQNDVIADLKLAGPGRPYSSLDRAKIALSKKVDVRLLLGGVLEVETRTHDPDEAQRLTAAYVRAVSSRIGQLGRQNTRKKREIVEERLGSATQRVSETEARFDAFRRENQLAAPDAQLGSEVSLRANLQAQLQAKLVELQMTQQFAGPENNQLIGVQSEIANLRSQLAQTARPSIQAGAPNLAGMSELSSRYFNLYRDTRLAQALFEVYSRANEQAQVEDLVAESASYIQVVEPAHLDPDRKYNIWAIGLFVALVLIALFTEWYAPATGLFRKRVTLESESLDNA